MNNLKNIKDILSDFEMEYDHNDWLKLEKDLPKSKKISSSSKTILLSAVAIITIATVLLLTIDKNDIKTPEITSTKINIEHNKPNKQFVEDNKLETNNSKQIKSSNICIINEPGKIEDKKTLINCQNDITQNTNNINNEYSKKHENITTKQPYINYSNNKTNTCTGTTNEENIIPSISGVTFDIKIINDCTPAKVIFIAENIPKNCDILWNTGDDNNILGNTIEYTYDKSGTYHPTVSITYKNFILRKEILNKVFIKKSSNSNINFFNTNNNYNFYCETDFDSENIFLWNIDNQIFNSENVDYTFNQTGKYEIILNIINHWGCKTSVSKTINIEPVYYVPNAFIPNNGDVNSYFGPIGENLEFKSYNLRILDLKGNIIFESFYIEEMWNGKINNNGVDADAGCYLWEIKIIDYLDTVYYKKGKVNLIRN